MAYETTDGGKEQYNDVIGQYNAMNDELFADTKYSSDTTAKVKVLSVDDRGKIGLSIKQLTPPPAPQPRPQRPQNDNRERRNNNGMRPQGDNRERRGGMRPQSARPMAPVSFEDKLSKFLKDSDDRMLDLKRNTESKRGGRGARRDK